MIREFQITDIDNFKPNEFSPVSDVLHILNDENVFRYSLMDGEEVKCIMVFKHYWEKNYVTLLLMAEDFRLIHAKEIKRFFDICVNIIKPDRLQTDSIDCPLLNRWHEFLGFKLEGTRPKFLKNKDYKMWGIVYGI